MALRPSGMTNDQWKQLSSAMVPPVVQRVVPAVEMPAPIATPPAKPKPGAFARGLFDAGAVTTDIAKAPIKGLADGANRLAIGGYNILREGVGMQPVQPRQFNYSATQDDLAAIRAENAQNPVAARPQTPAIAAPKSPTQQTQQRSSPSQRMTDSQANAAEVNARTATQTPTSPQTGVGASVGAGGAAPGGIVKSKDKNGNSVYTGTGAYATADAATPATVGTIGSVNRQNFGNPAVPQAQASIAQPRVASTFGLGVNDPRLNDQTPAIASPNAAARGFGLASADGTSRYYANKEDREAAKKLYDSMDTEAFRLSMAANNPGRRGRQAMETLSALRGQQAKLIGDQANNTAAQISDNTRGQFTLANTGMEQAGQTRRQQMAGDVTSQGQFLDYDAKNRATNASLIEKPQYVTDLSGNLVQVAGGKGTGVTGADGSVIKMPQTTKVDNDALSAVSKELTALINNPPEMGADATAYNNRLAELRAQQSAFLGGGQQASQKVPSPGAIDALKKNPALASKFDEWYGQGAAARYSK